MPPILRYGLKSYWSELMAAPCKQGANDKPKYGYVEVQLGKQWVYRFISLCKELLTGASLSWSNDAHRPWLSVQQARGTPGTFQHYIGSLLEGLRGPRAIRAKLRTAAEPCRESGWNLPWGVQLVSPLLLWGNVSDHKTAPWWSLIAAALPKKVAISSKDAPTSQALLVGGV